MKKKLKEEHKAKITGSGNLNEWWLLAAIAVITFLCFIPALNNGFVSYDDGLYVTANPVVQKPGLAIFTAYIAGHYHPLTLISLAIDHSIYDQNAEGFHFTNIFLHLCNLSLLFWFLVRLSNKVWLAAGVALLFGIFPTHVENVAWISERKDLLYSFFYIGAMYTYLRSIDEPAKRVYYLAITAVLFLLSLFSKEQAVTLPLILLLIDYYRGRKMEWKVAIEKIPFFLLSIGFGVLSIISQKESGAVTLQETYKIFPDRILFACYAFATYLWKAIFPFHLSVFYPYPPVTSSLVLLSPVVLAAVVFMMCRWRNDKEVIFGLLFFIFNIAPLLQIIPVGRAIVAERYSYISYTGLFYLVGVIIYRYHHKIFNTRLLFAGIGLYLLIIFIQANSYTRVWGNGITLFENAVKQYPCSYSYWNQGIAYMYGPQRFPEQAKACFIKAIETDPASKEGYFNLGKIYYSQNQPDSAMAMYNKALEIDGRAADVYVYMGGTSAGQKKYAQALGYFDKAISINPHLANLGFVYYQKAVVYYEQGNYKDAKMNAEKAKALEFDMSVDKRMSELQNMDVKN